MSGLFHKKTLRERELKDGKKPEEKARLITWLAQKKKDGQEDKQVIVCPDCKRERSEEHTSELQSLYS